MAKLKQALTTATFTLQCALCKNVDKRPVDLCKGSEPPACSKCGAPMILKSVSAK